MVRGSSYGARVRSKVSGEPGPALFSGLFVTGGFFLCGWGLIGSFVLWGFVSRRFFSRSFVYRSFVSRSFRDCDWGRGSGWRYGSGGDGFVYKSHFADNGIFASADKRSGIHVHDSYVSPAPAPAKRVHLELDVDSDGPRIAAEPKRWNRFPAESAIEVDLFKGHLPRISPRDRGAPQPKGGTDG